MLAIDPGCRLLALCACAVSLLACADGKETGTWCGGEGDAAAWVDPFIGTLGSGNAVPGALVPHGMVKLSPDSVVEPFSVDAYEYESERIEGFSHTHLQGPGGGANGYSHILFMPTTGALRTTVADYASRFRHGAETASPGYYAVSLSDHAVCAELTATAHAGYHRYTFPSSGQARVLVDLGHSRGESRGGRLVILPEQAAVRGCGTYSVHPLLDLVLSREGRTTARSTVCFHAVFDPPFESYGAWDAGGTRPGADRADGAGIGAWVEFAATDSSRRVEIKVGISLIDEDQAQRNLEEEIGQQGFAQVRAAAREAWNCLLGRVRIRGGTQAERRSFYTGLYHSLFQPADYTEAGGAFFCGADGQGQVFWWSDKRYYTDDWCIWDTFRTAHPLATLVVPERVDDVLASYLHWYEQGGWLPKCPWHATGYSRVMIGNHALAVIADAVTKGFEGLDPERAWEAVLHSAMADNPEDAPDPLCGFLNLGTPPEYVARGYVSSDCDERQGASMTLEYAYDDWCAARIAERIGKPAWSAYFDSRSRFYRMQYNPRTGFMQGRRRDGSWTEPFDPASEEDANDFCESSAWVYTWSVPHDPQGLIELLGGREAFVDKLDAFFDLGHHDVSNEPSFHVPFLYNCAGRAAKTQQRVHDLLDSEFSDAPDGLPGNDDAGATSAWYVFAAMGLYPLAPGDGRYEISSPLFDEIEIRLHPDFHPGERFVIRCERSAPEAIYIQSARLDGEPLERSWIAHAEIIGGGELELELGTEPSSWPE
ncbi:MAG: GH92 family glycosyl hydrolase [Deltaproteobacteria bacterium]|nr:GH92 family glycosyl hydrolase [Deltaproteobacteria bacterium]